MQTHVSNEKAGRIDRAEGREPVGRLRILQVSFGDIGARGGSGGDWFAWNLLNEYRQRGHKSWLAVGWRQSADPDVFLIPHGAATNLWSRAWDRLDASIRPLAGKVRGVEVLRELTHSIGHPSHKLNKWQGIEDFDFPGTWDIFHHPRERLDVVHLHAVQGDFFDLRVLPWLSNQVPVFVTLHDAWYMSGHCGLAFDFQHGAFCDRWKTGCGNCPDLSSYPAVRKDSTAFNWRRKREIYRASRLHVATPSRWLMERVEHSMVKDGAEDLRVIPNGVDLSTFRPSSKEVARQDLGLPKDTKVLLFVAYHPQRNPAKDLVTMRDAAIQVERRLKGQRIVFVVLGSVAPGTPIGDAEVISVPYQSDRQMVARYYQAADVYLHAALVETFSTTVIEAMACGAPVVATAVGGIPEIVTDGETGFLVPPRDSGAMADRAERLLDDEMLSQKISTNAAQEAHRRFGIDRQVEAYLKWYAEVRNNWS